ALDLAERVAPQRELPVPRQQLPPRKLASVELEGVVQRVVGPHFDRVRERERPVVVAFDAQVEPVIARQLKVERDAVQHRAPAGGAARLRAAARAAGRARVGGRGPPPAPALRPRRPPPRGAGGARPGRAGRGGARPGGPRGARWLPPPGPAARAAPELSK